MNSLIMVVLSIVSLILVVKIGKMEAILKVFAQGIGEHQGNEPNCTVCQAVNQSRKLLGIK